jgi:predicted  nucleic acid-binding Zn-ribbon protein
MELQKLKTNIDQAEKDLARFEGSLETLRERLNNEFNLKTNEEVAEELNNLSEQIKSIEDKIQGDLNKLKEVYEW